jgi:kynureninase
VFIHQRHIADPTIPRMAGWWGHDKESRFKMDKTFIPIPTAEGWQLSNAPVLSMAAHLASLEIFNEAGMHHLAEKGKELSGYLLFILNEINQSAAEKRIEVLTPENARARGCQVSMLMLRDGKAIFESLLQEGVIADWREPNVIRVAPVPLYNTFEDVYIFGKLLHRFLLG